jgi:hypothetical protein
MSAEEQAFRLGQAWEAMPEPKRQIVFQVVHPDGKVDTFRIGPHTPTMKTEDVHLVHRMWLRLRRFPGMEDVHHSDLVTLALTRLAQDFSREPEEIVRALRKGEGSRSGTLAAATQPAKLEEPKAVLPENVLDRRKNTRPSKDKFQGF